VDILVTRSGEERLIEWHDKTLKDADGHVTGLLAVGQDITERRKTEESLQRLNENLQQRVIEETAKNREKDHLLIQQSRLAAMGEMIGNIAHQWRQPINALSLLLVNISEAYNFGELDKEELDRQVKIGTRLIQQMSTTIDDFRNFFRPGKEKAPFSLTASLEGIVEILGASLTNASIALERDIPRDITVNGYANEYAQALLNVINNAKEAILAKKPAAGCIRVEVREENGMAVVRIGDNGGGIPEDVLPKIFDPYFTTKTKGTGIGLYMSQAIIETNMGGRIEVRNSGSGAEFTVAVPLS
jgi:signal transduction histidine kinase